MSTVFQELMMYRCVGIDCHMRLCDCVGKGLNRGKNPNPKPPNMVHMCVYIYIYIYTSILYDSFLFYFAKTAGHGMFFVAFPVQRVTISEPEQTRGIRLCVGVNGFRT